VGGLRLRIRSNDSLLLRTLVDFGESPPSEVCDLTWIIICDPELPSLLADPLVFESGPVVFLSFGRACFLAFHSDRKEIVGFIASGISEKDLAESILPTVLEVGAGMQP
jgi:hypothetical protein